MQYQVKKPEDLSKINSNDVGELLWWSYMLNTSPEKIVTSIEDVGISSEAVRIVVNRINNSGHSS